MSIEGDDDDPLVYQSAMSAELSSLASVLDAGVVIIHDVEGRILFWTSGCEREPLRLYPT